MKLATNNTAYQTAPSDTLVLEYKKTTPWMHRYEYQTPEDEHRDYLANVYISKAKLKGHATPKAVKITIEPVY